jgi:hypothetical protein
MIIPSSGKYFYSLSQKLQLLSKLNQTLNYTKQNVATLLSRKAQVTRKFTTWTG